MIFSKIKVLRDHGKQYITDLNAVELTGEFRGRPELSEAGWATDTSRTNGRKQAATTACAEADTINGAITGTAMTADIERAAAICPTGAISTAPFTLDMGRCLFCGECARIAPRNIRFTNDYRIAAPTREGLVVHPDQTIVEFDPQAVRPDIRKYFSRSLQLREVCAGGDASVEMELNASGNVNFDLGRYGIGFTASPRHADGVVVSGPITVNMAEALEICYDAVTEPKVLIVAGSEACSGGLFADSRAIDRSFLCSHAVDLWIPGAPTHPMTFIDGMLTLLGRKKRR